MAGIVVYGDLAEAMTGSGPVSVEGRLESVKLLPDHGGNEHELYGALTAQAAVSPDRETVDTPSDLQVLTTRASGLGGRLLTTSSGVLATRSSCRSRRQTSK